jgi:hypothetical protein
LAGKGVFPDWAQELMGIATEKDTTSKILRNPNVMDMIVRSIFALLKQVTTEGTENLPFFCGFKKGNPFAVHGSISLGTLWFHTFSCFSYELKMRNIYQKKRLNAITFSVFSRNCGKL